MLNHLIGWTEDSYNSFGDIRCKYCFELFWGSNKNLRINFYETNYVLGISRYVYRYRSSAMNNWISQHSYTSSVPSNSDLIGNATDTIVNNQDVNTNKIIQNENQNTDKIIANDNQNTDKIIQNEKENTDKIIQNQQEEGEKNRQHYEDMLWGTEDDDSDSGSNGSSSSGSSKEDKKKKGLVKSILEGITNIFLKVFVPRR